MRKWLPVLLLVGMTAIIYFGCSSSSSPIITPPTVQATKYVAADICSGCHIDKGNEWGETKHSVALVDLMTSDHVGDHCLACHTTGLDENSANSGYDDSNPAIAATFGGVQCEQCHGPGGEHVRTFDPLSKPIGAWMCGTCHDGSHHNTYSDWSGSLHALALSNPRDASSHFSLNCLECHSSDYRMADSVPEGATVWDFNFGITCVDCHDPHSDENEGQLRKPVAELCGECHTAGGAYPGESPHHSTADVLAGTGGYEYPGEEYTNSTHSELVDSCAACHMYWAPYVSSDEIHISGHSFEPTLESCQPCHPGLDTFDRAGFQSEIVSLLNILEAELDAATEADMETLSFERAEFNHHFVGAEGSNGIHNYPYVKKLLEDSIADFTPGA